MLESWYNMDDEKIFPKMENKKLFHEVLFKRAKLAHLISPMMLDCDNLAGQKGRANREKVTIMKRLFRFLNDITDCAPGD